MFFVALHLLIHNKINKKLFSKSYFNFSNGPASAPTKNNIPVSFNLQFSDLWENPELVLTNMAASWVNKVGTVIPAFILAKFPYIQAVTLIMLLAERALKMEKWVIKWYLVVFVEKNRICPIVYITPPTIFAWRLIFSIWMIDSCPWYILMARDVIIVSNWIVG